MDRLVTTYHYLCRRGARKFWRPGLERSDLEQVAALGLVKAARRYDASLATPFEAYAWLFIVGELMHHVRDHERLVRVPRRLRGLERPYLRAQERLVAELGREPSDVEVAHELGVSRNVLREIRQAREGVHAASLEGVDVAEHAALSVEDRVIVDGAFDDLDTTERRIIVGTYVLGLTQIELGRRLGLSARRVSRLRHAALARLQLAWAS